MAVDAALRPATMPLQVDSGAGTADRLQVLEQSRHVGALPRPVGEPVFGIEGFHLFVTEGG
jgi:hypothetical protein